MFESILNLPINLPPVVLGHSLFLSTMGISKILSPPPSPSKARGSATAPVGMQGILMLAIGVSYLATSYNVPMSKNVFLYASIPVRLALAALAATRILLLNLQKPSDVKGKDAAGQENVSKMIAKETKDMIAVLLVDGIGAVLGGWALGRFDGQLPSSI